MNTLLRQLQAIYLKNIQHQSINTNRNIMSPFKRISKPTIMSLVCALGLLSVTAQASVFNRIKMENTLQGNPEWWDDFNFPSDANTDPTGSPHDMEGYADKDSVNIGQSIKFYINANSNRDATYRITIYRLGWYNGVGARKVAGPLTKTSVIQTLPTPDAITGMVQANWSPQAVLNVPTNWTSGIYVATIIGNTTNVGQYIPFVVRDQYRSSDYVFQTTTTTWQAYNSWGGTSLYTNQRARKVSFNRPYDVGVGLGLLLGWDINMLYFLEREGYDVTYQSNIDTHIGDGGLLNHKAIISAGHDEYWSKAMRDNFENAQKHGVGLGFFGSNAAYWQIRLENSRPTSTGQSQANRTIVSYKTTVETEDPLAINASKDDDYLVTSTWRDPQWANRPENSLIGVMYAFWPVDGNITTTKSDPNLANGTPSHWIYTGTDVTNGFVLPGMLGYEADRVFNNGKSPANLEIVGSSTVPLSAVAVPYDANDPQPAEGPQSHMTVYTKTCSLPPCRNPVSTVFASGSMQWAWGLDTFAHPGLVENTQVTQITQNVLARLISAPLPAQTGMLTSMINQTVQALSDRDNNASSMKRASERFYQFETKRIQDMKQKGEDANPGEKQQ